MDFRLAGVSVVSAVLVAAGCAKQDSGKPAFDDSAKAGSSSAASIDDTSPGLKVGAAAPDATVLDYAGNEVSLSSLTQDGPVVVTFYRGGWCPYCNQELTEWQGKIEELKAAGGRIIALSPETPEWGGETSEKNDLDFEVYSDARLEASRAYRVLFELDDATKTKYKGYGIDLETRNSSASWHLPAPGTFVIADGKVVYAWADWDYKQRADVDEVIAAVKEAG